MAASIINLEEGMPRTDAAMMRLKLELATLRRCGVKCVKIIHGYGSTGTGGAIRIAARNYLREQQQESRIRAFCPGEQFGPFETVGRKIFQLMSSFRHDPDWGSQNDGITMVVI